MSTGLKILLTVGIFTIYLVVVAGLALLLAGWQDGKKTAFVRGAILGVALSLLVMALSWVWRVS